MNVVNDILDMSKIEAGKFKIVKEPFDVAPLVKSCCDIMRHTAEQRSLSLIMDVAPGIPELPADKRACKQMLLNRDLERHQVHRSGRLGARLGARAPTAMSNSASPTTASASPKQDLPKLGNPFVQANNSYDRSYDGAGLGLSVVKGLARLHGGRLELAEQRSGRGRSPRSSCRSRARANRCGAPLEPPTVSAA